MTPDERATARRWVDTPTVHDGFLRAALRDALDEIDRLEALANDRLAELDRNYDRLGERISRLEGYQTALIQIAEIDYRGHPSVESEIARKALRG